VNPTAYVSGEGIESKVELSSFGVLLELINAHAPVQVVYDVCPVIDVTLNGIGSMSIGLSVAEFLLMVQRCCRPTCYSLGDVNIDGDAVFYFGDYTAMSRKYLIPTRKALLAIKEWYDFGSLSPDIDWTERLY
jgi:hypothetical protein